MADQFMYFGPKDEERDKPMTEHKVYCNLRVINDIERVFGQKFDDEKLKKLMEDRKLINEYSWDISYYMARTKPSPLSVKDLYTVYTIGGSQRRPR
jgi:benzoyl-CoA reductase/2-hydroxyglutaryl-CoA dehydratase subunit BcrC/BadD/HgdB